MKLFSLLSAVIVLCGCQSSNPKEAHLSRAQAIEIANKAAIEHKERIEDYKSPEVQFDAERYRWLISFPNKRPYAYGDPRTYHYFAIVIDDKTGNAKYEPYALK